MPRPTKCRAVCFYPTATDFIPTEGDPVRPPVILRVDEYEMIRLIDHEGLSQEACAARMGVARTTVQQVYTDARKKLASVLVEGLPLRIEGGVYRLCDGNASWRDCGHCFKRTVRENFDLKKGEQTMRIAVTYENGEIFQHFGHTQFFKVYDVENGAIVASQVVDTNGSGHGALAGVLTALHVDALICGGIGGGAQAALAAAGIRLFGGVSGSADAAAQALAEGKLTFDPNVHCDHHDHGGAEHTCGHHGRGEHHCGHEM